MSDSAPIFVCGPVRSPIGKFGGGLSTLMPADLSVPVATAALDPDGYRPSHEDEHIIEVLGGSAVLGVLDYICRLTV